MGNVKKPLGYISLLNKTQKPVYPMDDFFINYTFHKEYNWTRLVVLLNIFLDEYAEIYKRRDGFHRLDNNIMVETQYEHYMKEGTKQPVQDINIKEINTGNETYIEFQNKRISKPPISIRASNYSGLSVNNMKDGTKNSQIWLLAENDDTVLRGKTITNFRMVEDNYGDYYPRAVNIMFISLPRLAEKSNRCGFASRLLLGEELDALQGELKEIADMFKNEYENFKRNKEVVRQMTIYEEKYAEGFAEGEAIGEANVTAVYKAKVENLLRGRLQRNEPISSLIDMALEFGISSERLAELQREA
jgi:hypothetical protein